MRRAEIEQLLPSVIRRTVLPGTPTHAALEVMEALHEPAEAVLTELDGYVDPFRAPVEHLKMLAEWVDLGWLVSRAGPGSGALPEDALRRLVAQGAMLAQLRGTREGLVRILSLATGTSDFEVIATRDAQGDERPFAFTVVAPAELEARVGLIATILRHTKPAYVQCQLRFGRDGEPLLVTDAPTVVPAPESPLHAAGGRAGRVEGSRPEPEGPELRAPEAGGPEPGGPEAGTPEPGAPEPGAPEPRPPEPGLGVPPPPPPGDGRTNADDSDRPSS